MPRFCKSRSPQHESSTDTELPKSAMAPAVPINDRRLRHFLGLDYRTPNWKPKQHTACRVDCSRRRFRKTATKDWIKRFYGCSQSPGSRSALAQVRVRWCVARFVVLGRRCHAIAVRSRRWIVACDLTGRRLAMLSQTSWQCRWRRFRFLTTRLSKDKDGATVAVGDTVDTRVDAIVVVVVVLILLLSECIRWEE